MKSNTLASSAIALVAAALTAGAASASEVIGPWNVRAADSASLTTDPMGSITGWLNVANAPVTVNEAFSGSNILDDGIANAAIGYTVEVVFNTPVVNLPGPDMVMFEAQFDAGDYAISTDFDGFAASLALPASSFIDTGEVRDYFFELNSDGPFSASIWGGAFDLSALGVPNNASVSAIRFTSTNNMTDPIGLAAIVPAPAGVAALALGGLAAMRRRRG
jgi:hypothetical protein